MVFLITNCVQTVKSIEPSPIRWAGAGSQITNYVQMGRSTERYPILMDGSVFQFTRLLEEKDLGRLLIMVGKDPFRKRFLVLIKVRGD